MAPRAGRTHLEKRACCFCQMGKNLLLGCSGFFSPFPESVLLVGIWKGIIFSVLKKDQVNYVPLLFAITWNRFVRVLQTQQSVLLFIFF